MSVITILALLCSMICTVSAAQEDFVASITYKDAPEIVAIGTENGQTIIGNVMDAQGDVIGKITDKCLVVTPIAKATTSPDIPDAAEEVLLDVYGDLVNGDMKLPYEKLAAYNGQNMVIRELLDVSWICTHDGEHHANVVEPTGVTFSITFNLGVPAGVEVSVMTYKNDQWNPIVSSVNNGDGTVTCVFEHLCPVAFSVPTGSVPTPPTGDAANPMLWGAMMAASAVVLVALVVAYTRKRKVAE